MSNVTTLVGLHPKGDGAGEGTATDASSAAMAKSESHAGPTPPDDLGTAGRPLDGGLALKLAKFAIAVLALGWTGLIGLLWAHRGFALPPLEQLPLPLLIACTPLMLLAILYTLVMRSRTSEAARYTRITAHLRMESEALDLRLAYVNQQLEATRTAMQQQADLLESYGAAASANMESAARLLGEHVVTANSHAETIRKSGEEVHGRFTDMFELLPDAEARALAIGAQLEASSQSLSDRVERLEAKLEALANLTEEARSGSLSATQSITAQLKQLRDSTRSATDELEGMATLADTRIGTAVDRARQAMDETNLTLEARMADLNLLVHNTGSALNSIGDNCFATFGTAIDDARAKLGILNDIIGKQTRVIAEANSGLTGTLEDVRHGFATLEQEGTARTEKLGTALSLVRSETEKLDAALRTSNDTLAELIGRSEKLIVALDTNLRELEDVHPATLAQFNEKMERSRALAARVAPEIESMATIASALFERTSQAEQMLRSQSQQLNQSLESSQDLFIANSRQVKALEDTLANADEAIRHLAEGSAPQLVASLMRINEAAEQAAERAKGAIFQIIPEAADALGQASETALVHALNEQVEARMRELSVVAERAVKTAHSASERLMRQLLTIADTSASVESRMHEADEAAKERDRDHFARRSALLIEKLHSASIDIARGLSGEVSDTAWSAYLKGDRGVFTRRAVRLLEPSQTRAITQLYDSDPAFREQVNIYIHDFEAMLRTILSTRDGNPLSVAILSSDIGKLYVVLAQAIERLRS